jgi:hypothetical protein
MAVAHSNASKLILRAPIASRSPNNRTPGSPTRRQR